MLDATSASEELEAELASTIEEVKRILQVKQRFELKEWKPKWNSKQYNEKRFV